MKDVTLDVSRGIREELGGFRRDVDQRLTGVDQRLEAVERRQTATEMRLATEIVAVVGAIHELRDVLVADRAVRDQVRDHEARLQRLEGRSS